ncbi:T-box transcription factor TBX6-like [Osmia bicornis bicornis]|uniref:T-box transcription factor TBX6-like n=1 Tax=Osmia bicornis bicornis TaxID=1437191 RepID=UPI0010F51D26|nr:T-box transcription factor TBX6-like [Osmia bicornis bicornis]
MNSIMAMPTELQLQLHQQMLFRQQQLVLRRHRPEDIPHPNAWPIPRFGGGPPLPPEVKVELENRELWQQFHAETTEMVITKVGRRMFPSIQLTITGLERRARYCVLIEVEPASNRRHKYVGGGVEKACGNARGWTSAGPAEPQPRIDRRIYLHPESPATGAHWMQHPLSFHKLKLTNNAVDPRSNVVLTSMHKYIPRIWIIRCDDVTRLSDLYTHPSSSFQFNETEFIAVTAYQNENITKLKINNNPFAKGFRETGQSRCKRKFQQTDGEGTSRIDEDDGNMSSESESNRSSHLDVVAQRPKTASSETGSLDDSGVSSCGGISPPLPSIHQNSPSRDVDRDTQPRLHRPWVDSSSEFSSSSMASSSTSLSSPYSDLNSYYFRFLHPSIAMQSDFMRLQYQSIVNSKYQ